MTVYVLMLEYDYEPSYLRGVYSTLEEARKAAALVAMDTGMDKLAIYPVQLDADPLDLMADPVAVDPVAP